MAHLQRRGTRGNYKYRVRYIDDEGTERSRTFALKGDADMFLVAISHQLLAGTYIDPSAGKITLRAQAEAWRLNQAHLRPGSVRSLEEGFRVHVYPYLGQRPLAAVRPSDIAAWQRGRLKPEGPLAPATVKRIRGQLSAMYKAAILDRIVNVNPVSGVKAPTLVKAEIVPLTAEQVYILEANLKQERYRAIVALVAGSGLRISETFGLTVDRVDFLRKAVRVDRQLVGRHAGGAPKFGPPKTAKSNRTVPLADITLYALSEHLRKFPAGEHGLLFSTREGGALTRSVFGASWRPGADAIGLPKGQGLHQIRHFYASVLIEAGRSVVEVQERLGHSSAVETLDTYAHLWPSNSDGTRAAIEAALFRPSQAVIASVRPS